MANIPALPSGHEVLRRAKAVKGTPLDYGPGGCTIIYGENMVTLHDEQGLLAQTRVGGGYTVTMKRVHPGNIGYVNRFIADWGKVERNWRTKQYVVKSGITEALASDVEATTQLPTPVAPVAPQVIPATPVEVEPTPEPVVVAAASAPVIIDAPVQDLGALIPAAASWPRPRTQAPR